MVRSSWEKYPLHAHKMIRCAFTAAPSHARVTSGENIFTFSQKIFETIFSLLTCEVIILPECAEGLSVLLLIVIPPEEGILNIFLGY